MRINEPCNILEVFEAPRVLHEELENCIDRTMSLASAVTKTTVVLTGMPGGGSGKSKDSTCINYISAKDSIGFVRDKEREARQLVSRIIDGAILSDRQRSLLCKHFLCGETWKNIAAGLGVSERTVYRDLDDAVYHSEKYYKECCKND